MFISKIAVRQSIFFSIIAERYPNIVFSNADNASLNRYFNLKGVRSLDATATRALIESLPEDWEAAKALINNELSSQDSGSEKEAVAKALGVDAKELDSAELISWLKSRYIDNTAKEMHPVVESMPVVKKFLGIRSAILQKLSEDEGFKGEFALRGINEESLKDSLKLTSDDMLWIMNQYEHGGKTSIRTVGVEIREGEYLGKVGEWNIWFPHSQETSAKIAGYDDATKEPHTTWCTARTKGSNLYYHYVSRNSDHGYIHSFLFYIIRDNPKEDNDWLSLGFDGKKANSIKPVLDGQPGGLTVNRANKGLIREDFDKILGADTTEKIFGMCQNHIEEELNYKHPAVEELKSLAKDPDAVKKALFNKSAEERASFYNVITQHNLTEDVLVEFCRFADLSFIKENFSKEWMQKPNYRLKGKIPLDLALKNAAEVDSYDFLKYFLKEPLAKPYLNIAAKGAAEKESFYFLMRFSEESFAQPYLELAAKNMVEKDPINFMINLSEKPLAKPYLELAANNIIKIDPHDFLRLFSEKHWANKPVASIGGKTWVEYAREMIDKKEASSINIRLKKLAAYLSNNKYPEEVKKLMKLL